MRVSRPNEKNAEERAHRVGNMKADSFCRILHTKSQLNVTCGTHPNNNYLLWVKTTGDHKLSLNSQQTDAIPDNSFSFCLHIFAVTCCLPVCLCSCHLMFIIIWFCPTSSKSNKSQFGFKRKNACLAKYAVLFISDIAQYI